MNKNGFLKHVKARTCDKSFVAGYTDILREWATAIRPFDPTLAGIYERWASVMTEEQDHIARKLK